MQHPKTRLVAGLIFFSGAVAAFAQPNYPQYKPRPRATSTGTAAGTPSVTPSPGGVTSTGTPSATPSPGGVTSTGTPSATPGGTASSNTATPGTPRPTGPLKTISTDGTNKQSPIRVTELNYYDEGYGSKYNSEVRISGAVQNSSKTDELKRVVVKLQVVDLKGDVIQEWKENPGTLRPGQTFRVSPAVWRNSLGTMLKGRLTVDHEEVVPKDPAKAPK